MRVSIKLFCALLSLFLLAACNQDDPNAGFNAEVSAIDTYLAKFKSKYWITDIYGYSNRIDIHSMGDGAPAHLGQTVQVSYTGRLFNDSSVVFKQGVITDKLDNITISGLQISIASLPQGTEATVYIPSKNAFGGVGTTGVPANATVRYDISIDTVYMTNDEFTQLKKDTAAIQAYLKSKAIGGVVYHPSGLFYKIEAAGTGDDFAKPYDYARFHYKLQLVSNESTLEESDAQLTIYGLIDGLKIGMTKMKEGGKATFYIPSGLAYGTAGTAKVPANAPLIFSINLNSIN